MKKVHIVRTVVYLFCRMSSYTVVSSAINDASLLNWIISSASFSDDRSRKVHLLM